ncbi:TIGR00282 family metallophosphoesterase [Thermoflavimicrobium daqui]|uniref:TIGR00282 family metallophosphoesterase n=1 Tax=Thermoflavimicrobium daqui TaxID=2137476 RepID=A0A364K7Y7_9BACL|nr:TIGR00282 family metallophosphoesterase [Thermoflavimicrobium daqui]RAL26403.1 TIGR00282 family metallophosphoesterase [Thermoflavimicrobium daqui]
MKILMLGDIVGELGRYTLLKYLAELKTMLSPDLVIVNGENSAANGRGITRTISRELLGAGVDCITLGNHAWAQSEVFDFIESETKVVRPANFPPGTPGRGFATITTSSGKCTVISLMGRTFLQPLECPFRTIDKILQKIPESHYIIVDLHAETTSEKQSLAWYVDGRVSAVIGTHTHVQTADERILPQGTGYLTDVGMVGPYDGVLGMEKDAVIRRFLTQLPVRFEVAKGRCQLNGIFMEFDSQTKKAKKLKRIRIDEDNPLIS